MATWKIPSIPKGTLGISVESPYSVTIEAISPMECVEHGDPKAEMVKGYLNLQTDFDEDLPLEVKKAFQEDIEYCVQSGYMLRPARVPLPFKRCWLAFSGPCQLWCQNQSQR